MNPIRSLDQLIADLKAEPSRRVVVAAGHDPQTIKAAARAVLENIAEITLVGERRRIDELCEGLGLESEIFAIQDEEDEVQAGLKAIQMVHSGVAQVIMKGLISTDKYMRLILDKAEGLLPAGQILTHLTVFDLPAYQKLHGKLLFASDVAIIPAPDLSAKCKILEYCIAAAHSFGIVEPRAALVAASEKVSAKMPATLDAAIIAKMAERGQFPVAIVDGPLALDVALSPQACQIKGLTSPVGGAADILVFPNIETGNAFYKACTLLAGARLAAAVVGTSAPCVLTSRADDEESKFLSIALGCRLATHR